MPAAKPGAISVDTPPASPSVNGSSSGASSLRTLSTTSTLTAGPAKMCKSDIGRQLASTRAVVSTEMPEPLARALHRATERLDLDGAAGDADDLVEREVCPEA